MCSHTDILGRHTHDSHMWGRINVSAGAPPAEERTCQSNIRLVHMVGEGLRFPHVFCYSLSRKAISKQEAPPWPCWYHVRKAHTQRRIWDSSEWRGTIKDSFNSDYRYHKIQCQQQMTTGHDEIWQRLKKKKASDVAKWQMQNLNQNCSDWESTWSGKVGKIWWKPNAICNPI